MIRLILFLSIFVFSLYGEEESSDIKTLKFRSALIKGTKQIEIFRKSLSQLKEAKQQLLEFTLGKNKDSKKAKELAGQIDKLEAHMLQKYGIYPDVPYIASPETATVSLLLTEEQLEKLSGEKPTAENGTAEGERTRYPVIKLTSGQAVQNFIADAKKGDLIRKRIESLKSMRKEKGVEEQKKIAEQIKNLEEQLNKYDDAMKKTYKVHSNLDYILDTTSLSVYMVINSEDLKMIGLRNKNKVEKNFKESLKK